MTEEGQRHRLRNRTRSRELVGEKLELPGTEPRQVELAPLSWTISRGSPE